MKLRERKAKEKQSTIRAFKRFRNFIKRRRKRLIRQAGIFKYEDDIRKLNKILKRGYKSNVDGEKRRKITLSYSPTLSYILSKKDTFSKVTLNSTHKSFTKIPEIGKKHNGIFVVPEIFSLTENPEESFDFIKLLLLGLRDNNITKVIIDYAHCQKIDLDASIVMDIILKDFISYYHKCGAIGHPTKNSITPINFNKDHIRKILFSTGAFKNIRNFHIEYPDIITYPLCIGNRSRKEDPLLNAARKEVDITRLVEYVVACLGRMNKMLTVEAESELYKIIGEILINAEEHATTQYRYSIGFFQDSQEDGFHVGKFNLVILNFGQTIYEKFKDPDCPNQTIVRRMEELSRSYTKKGLFRKAEFEEETLWTLYSLQEGVTSKANWKRGNGSIRFIEGFFNLKGNNRQDDRSKLVILSGNAKIVFDGTYQIVKKQKGNNTFKIMAFNDTGDIEDKPNKKFVTFVQNYFPGTIISANILVKEDDTVIIDSNENL